MEEQDQEVFYVKYEPAPMPPYDPNEIEQVPSDEPGTSKMKPNPQKRKLKSNISNPVKKSRINTFSTEEKRLLAAAVQENRCIWDLSDPLHQNHGAVDAAWKRIATKLVKNVEECKKAWISLKDSNRYRKKINPKKSGSSGGVRMGDVDEEVEIVEWEFQKDLDFLPDVSKSRSTFQTIKVEGELEGKMEGQSNYDYLQKNQKNHSKDDDIFVQLASSVSELIKSQVSQEDEPPKMLGLKFQTMWQYMDEKLQSLPQEDIEDFEQQTNDILFSLMRARRSKRQLL